MRRLIDFLHHFAGNMRVLLRGRERTMPKNLFNEQQVSAILQQMRGERMPQACVA